MLSLNTFLLVAFVLQGLCDVGNANAIPYDGPNVAGNYQRPEPKAKAKANAASPPSFPTGFPSPTGLPSLPSGFPSLPSGFPSLPSGLPSLPSGLPSLPSGLIPKLPLPTGFPSTSSDKPSLLASAINGATSISGDISKLIQDVSTESFPKLIPVLMEDFRKLTVSYGTALSQLADSNPMGDLDTKGIVTALTGFVKVSQNVSDALIGQKGFFAQYSMLAPIRMGLLALKNLADKFALLLIGFIPTESPFINQARGGFENILRKTLNEYGPEHEL